MSWYHDEFQLRRAITVHNAAGAASLDVDVEIPAEWDEFFDGLVAASDVTGNSIRVTDSDGVTLLSYKIDDGAGGSFNSSVRAGRIRIDGVTVPAVANSVVCLWLYYYTQGDAGDASVAVTMSSVVTGYIDLGRPTAKSHTVRSTATGRTTPSVNYQKGSGDSDDVWLDWSSWIEQSNVQQYDHTRYEEPHTMVITAVDEGGTPTTAVYTPSACRWSEQPDGRLFFRVQVTGGTDGTNYTIKPKISTIVPGNTADHRVFEERFGLHVVDVQEGA